MKNNTTHLILGVMLFLFCEACAHYTDNTYATLIYRYINESGVEVALVGETQGYFDIPDSLVLQNGESYECSDSFPGGADMSLSFPYKEGNSGAFIPLKIYFDKAICKTYYVKSTNQKSRNPFLRDYAYVETTREEKHKKDIETINTYTYTFTAADYQNALKAQE